MDEQYRDLVRVEARLPKDGLGSIRRAFRMPDGHLDVVQEAGSVQNVVVVALGPGSGQVRPRDAVARQQQLEARGHEHRTIDRLDPDRSDLPLRRIPERPWDLVPSQLYNLDCVAYESVMLGAFSVWRGECPDGTKKQDVCLGFSRDGFSWDRPDRRAFIPVSEKQGDWNWGNIQSAGGACLVVGDRRASAATDGTDTVRGIEQLLFADGSVAYVLGAGSSNQARRSSHRVGSRHLLGIPNQSNTLDFIRHSFQSAPEILCYRRDQGPVIR